MDTTLRKRSVAFLDVSGTIYRGFLFKRFIQFLIKKGCPHQDFLEKLQVSLEAIESLKVYFKEGLVSYEEQVELNLQSFADALTGESLSFVKQQAKSFIMEEKEHGMFFPFIQELFDVLISTHDIYLVSADQTFLIEEIAMLFKVTGSVATLYDVTANNERERCKFSGKILFSLGRRQGKKLGIIEVENRHKRGDEEKVENSIAIGDAPGDIGMLGSVENAVVLDSGSLTSEFRDFVEAQGWTIRTPDTIVNFIKESVLGLL